MIPAGFFISTKVIVKYAFWSKKSTKICDIFFGTAYKGQKEKPHTEKETDLQGLAG